MRTSHILWVKVCLLIRQVCFSGQMSLRVVTELLKTTPVLLKRLI